MVKLAVVILNWNGKELLERFLPALCAFTSKEVAEIVVADNGSTDGSAAFVASAYPQIRLLSYPDNKGYAGGYNRALREVDAEFYCLLNSDIEVTQGWTEAPVAFLEQHPRVAAVQPKLRSYSRRELFEYAGAAGGFIDRYGYPYCRGRLFDSVEADLGQYDDAVPIGWASGAALFIRSKSFWAVEGFDETFFAHMEEIDLALRLRRRGEQLYYVPQSVVYHVGGATLSGESPLKVKLNYRNNLLMLYKNLPRSKSRTVLFARAFLDTLSKWVYRLKGEKAAARAVIEARKEYRAMRHAYTPPKNGASLPLLPGKGSVVWAYFARKRHRFTDLPTHMQGQ